MTGSWIIIASCLLISSTFACREIDYPRVQSDSLCECGKECRVQIPLIQSAENASALGFECRWRQAALVSVDATPTSVVARFQPACSGKSRVDRLYCGYYSSPSSGCNPILASIRILSLKSSRLELLVDNFERIVFRTLAFPFPEAQEISIEYFVEGRNLNSSSAPPFRCAFDPSSGETLADNPVDLKATLGLNPTPRDRNCVFTFAQNEVMRFRWIVEAAGLNLTGDVRLAMPSRLVTPSPAEGFVVVDVSKTRAEFRWRRNKILDRFGIDHHFRVSLTSSCLNSSVAVSDSTFAAVDDLVPGVDYSANLRTISGPEGFPSSPVVLSFLTAEAPPRTAPDFVAFETDADPLSGVVHLILYVLDPPTCETNGVLTEFVIDAGVAALSHPRSCYRRCLHRLSWTAPSSTPPWTNLTLRSVNSAGRSPPSSPLRLSLSFVGEDDRRMKVTRLGNSIGFSVAWIEMRRDPGPCRLYRVITCRKRGSDCVDAETFVRRPDEDVPIFVGDVIDREWAYVPLDCDDALEENRFRRRRDSCVYREKTPPGNMSFSVAAEPIADDAVSLTWDAFSCDLRGAGLSFEIVTKSDKIRRREVFTPSKPWENRRRFTAENLDPGVEFSFRVRPFNDWGVGRWSSPVVARTPTRIPVVAISVVVVVVVIVVSLVAFCVGFVVFRIRAIDRMMLEESPTNRFKGFEFEEVEREEEEDFVVFLKASSGDGTSGIGSSRESDSSTAKPSSRVTDDGDEVVLSAIGYQGDKNYYIRDRY